MQGVGRCRVDTTSDRRAIDKEGHLDHRAVAVTGRCGHGDRAAGQDDCAIGRAADRDRRQLVGRIGDDNSNRCRAARSRLIIRRLGGQGMVA